MSLVTILAALVCPLLSVPFLIIGLKKDRKHRIVYLGIVAFMLALTAYCFVPTEQDDLYRLHLEAGYNAGLSSDGFNTQLSNGTEQLAFLYKTAIGKLGNLDLMQFFITFFAYFIIFYILNDADARAEKPISKWKRLSIWLFTIVGFNYMTLATNLYCNFALEIFSLGIYLEYQKGVKKPLCMLLYVSSVFIHSSAFLLLAIYFIFWLLMREKTTLRSLIILSAVILSIGTVLPIINGLIKLPLVDELILFYKAYFNNEEAWADLHTPGILALYLSKIVINAVFFITTKEHKKIDHYSFLITCLVIILFFQTSFSIRYIPVILLCEVPLLYRTLGTKKHSSAYAIMLYAFSAPQIAYQIYQLSKRHFVGLPEIITRDIFTTFGGNK